jgi:hypothetical protein
LYDVHHDVCDHDVYDHDLYGQHLYDRDHDHDDDHGHDVCLHVLRLLLNIKIIE